MSKFHVSKDGIARQCRAKGSCPLGGEDSHFGTREEAQEFSDNGSAHQYGLLALDKVREEMNKSDAKENFLPKLGDINKMHLDKDGRDKYKELKQIIVQERNRARRINGNGKGAFLLKETSMPEYLNRLRNNPDGAIFVDENSWRDMENKYYEVVDEDFIKNGEKAFSDREYLKQLHARAQSEGLAAGLRYKPGVDPDNLKPSEIPEGFYRYRGTKEDVEAHKEAYNTVNKTQETINKLQPQIDSVSKRIEKYSTLGKILRARKYSKDVNTLRKLEQEYKDNEVANTAAQFKLNIQNEKRKLEPAKAIYDELISQDYNSIEMEKVFHLTGERHGLHELGVDVKIYNPTPSTAALSKELKKKLEEERKLEEEKEKIKKLLTS